MSSLGMRALHTVPLLCSTSSFFNPLKLQQIISTLPAFIFFVFLREFTISLCSCQGTVVGSSGLEPPTSRLSGARSNQLSYEPVLPYKLCVHADPRPLGRHCRLQRPGGDERVRTAGLLLARQALYQLSYTPTRLRFRCVVNSTI